MPAGFIARRFTAFGLIALGAASMIWCGVEVARVALFERRETAALNQALVTEGSLAPDEGAESRLPMVPDVPGLIGRLEIPRLRLSAIVMQGDDDRTLKLAVGHLPDTAMPWENGNTALAGHRDTFFRPLKGIHVGDEITLTSVGGLFVYRVTDTRVVLPDDVSVLAPTGRPALTLVTCYPFYFIGAAPKRYIVRADRVDSPRLARTRAVDVAQRIFAPPNPKTLP